MKIKALFVFFILIALSCCPVKEFYVTKGNASVSNTNYSMVYALPQTVLHVSIETEKVYYKKGKYAEYASKYLALENVPTSDSIYWRISSTKIEVSIEADPSNYYTVTFKSYPENIQKLFTLSDKGIVLNIADSWKSLASSISQTYSFPNFDPHIIDETIKEKTDTIYKTIVTDSTINKIPIIKKKVIVKTEEDFAKEAAHELLKTRKRKLKTLRGEYDYHPDGEALKIMIKELDQAEKMYLEMFIGSTYIEKKVQTKVIIPDSNLSPVVLGNFSESLGFTEVDINQSAPLVLSLRKEQEIKQTAQPEKGNNIIFIKVPITSNCKLKIGEKVITETRIPIYQAGYTTSLSLNQ
jgi:hypothetical protein